MDNKHSIHMTIDEFKNNGYKVIDWIADYYKNMDSFPVLSQAAPGDIRELLPDQPPEDGETFEAVLADMNEKILPGITHWQSPNFFAFFPCNSTGPAILGDMLSTGLGVQGMLWATSPACNICHPYQFASIQLTTLSIVLTESITNMVSSTSRSTAHSSSRT